MTDLANQTYFDYLRVGPVYLWWSEWCDRAVVGPAEGAWGGEDIYRCEAHPKWQSDGDEFAHMASHGYYLSPASSSRP